MRLAKTTRAVTVLALVLVPAVAVGAAPGEKHTVNGRCVTLTRIDGQQASWSWQSGGSSASGNLPVSALGARCDGQGGSPASQPAATVEVGKTYTIEGRCARVVRVNGGQIAYEWTCSSRWTTADRCARSSAAWLTSSVPSPGSSSSIRAGPARRSDRGHQRRGHGAYDVSRAQQLPCPRHPVPVGSGGDDHAAR